MQLMIESSQMCPFGDANLRDVVTLQAGFLRWLRPQMNPV
jgi:hypothetical protein